MVMGLPFLFFHLWYANSTLGTHPTTSNIFEH